VTPERFRCALVIIGQGVSAFYALYSESHRRSMTPILLGGVKAVARFM